MSRGADLQISNFGKKRIMHAGRAKIHSLQEHAGLERECSERYDGRSTWAPPMRRAFLLRIRYDSIIAVKAFHVNPHICARPAPRGIPEALSGDDGFSDTRRRFFFFSSLVMASDLWYSCSGEAVFSVSRAERAYGGRLYYDFRERNPVRSE